MKIVKTKLLENNAELVQMPAHFIGEAFDEFIVSDNVGSILTCLIKLSIGIETYIKSLLHSKEPLLLTRIDWSCWKLIKKNNSILDDKERTREIIKSLISDKKELSKTLDYGLALELFPVYFDVPQSILKDLSNLKDYRNGLFHWKASDASEYNISKQTFRLFKWLNLFIEQKNGHWLGDEFIFIDPMGDRRAKLLQIEDALKNEVTFLVQRRIFRCHREYGNYYKVKARLDKTVFIPHAIQWDVQSCPACSYSPMQIYWNGGAFGTHEQGCEHYLNCIRCNFTCSGKEFDIFKSQDTPSLESVVNTILANEK